MNSTINYMLFIHALILLGYIFTFGNFSKAGIFILIISFLIWLIFYIKRKLPDKIFNFSPNFIIYFSLCFSQIMTLTSLDPTILQPGIIERPENFIKLVWVARILLTTSLFMGLFFFYFKKPLLIFWLILTFVAIERIVMINVSPNPRIDTYDIIKLGSQGILQGQNPYQMNYPALYPGVTPDYFSYTSGILYLTTPLSPLIHDHRFIFLAAEIGAAILMYLLVARKSKVPEAKTYAQILPLIYISNPTASFMILRGWSDPLVIFLLTLISTLVIIKKQEKFALIILGYLISLKQTLIFIPIFFIKWLRAKPKFLLVILTALLINLPFFLLSPKDFIEDVVIFHINNAIRYDALMLNTLFFSFTRNDIPNFLFLIIWAILAVTILLRQKNKFDEIFLGLGLWYFAFFLFNNKQAFVNYYYFTSSIIILYLVVKLSTQRNGE